MPRPILLAALAGAAGSTLLAASCAPPRGDLPPGRPLSWRMVEVETPGGKQLVLEAYDPGPPAVEIRFLGEPPVVGAAAEAEVRLPGSSGVHTVEVYPTRPEVRILGPRAFDVRGEGPVRVRFTSDAAGKGGIGVAVRD